VQAPDCTGRASARVSEPFFIHPSISDFGTIFRNRRQEASRSLPPPNVRPRGRALGTNFIDALSHALRTPDALTWPGGGHLAPTAIDGAALWPRTKEDRMSYIAGFAVMEVAVRGVLPIGDTTENVPYFILDTAKNAVVGQVILPKAVKRSLAVALTVKVPAAAGSFAIGTFDDGGNFQACSFLRVESPAVERPDGAVGSSGR